MNSYTVSLMQMSRDSIESDNPFLVREVGNYERTALEEMGLTFVNETEGLRAAKRLYWTNVARKLATRPGHILSIDGVCPWVIAYDRAEEMLVPSQCLRPATDICFASKEEADNALKTVGVENWAKYVIGLSGLTLKVPVRI